MRETKKSRTLPTIVKKKTIPNTYSVKGYSRRVKGKSTPALDQFANRVDEIVDLKNLTEFLFLNRDLTREEFEAKVLETGYRAMIKTLVALACSGDTKALDLGLKQCLAHFSKHRQIKVQDDATPLPPMKPRGETQ